MRIDDRDRDRDGGGRDRAELLRRVADREAQPLRGRVDLLSGGEARADGAHNVRRLGELGMVEPITGIHLSEVDDIDLRALQGALDKARRRG